MAETQGVQRAFHRRHRNAGLGRGRQISVRLSDEEFAAIAQAATATGLTPTGFTAAAAVAAARGKAAPSVEPGKDELGELVRLRVQLVKAGTNLNQLARAANEGRFPEASRLEDAAARVREVIDRADAAAGRLGKGLR